MNFLSSLLTNQKYISITTSLPLKANAHDAICGNNLWHKANNALCECKNRTNLSQLSQGNVVVTTSRSYKLLLEIADKLLLQIALRELALKGGAEKRKDHLPKRRKRLLLFVLAMEHTLLHKFLSIWCEILFPGDLHDAAL